jgi:putative membrane protein
VAILAASVIELALFIRAVVAQADWLAGVWLVVLSMLAVLILKWLVIEYRGLKQLKRQDLIRNQSKKMADSEVIGRAEQHCLQIAETLPIHCQPLVEKWQKCVESHHNDKEILSLFEHKVIAKVDQLAMQQISKNASAASVMIAVSPFALVDMLIVLWRNIHMMDQVSEIYGLRLGYWARIRLIKNIFHTMLFAGAAEILSDAGNYALGTSITGKLSTRVAQGLGAGILTARIGLKAIDESRPLPWLSESKPGLSKISRQLMSDLQKQLS